MLRFLAFALAVFLAGPAQAATTAGRLEFAVTRNGEPFGTHTVTVTAANGDLTARSAVALRAAVGPVTVYRYEHSCNERWRSGVLQALNCATLQDGRRSQISATRAADAISVQGPGGVTMFPGNALPTSWWTRSVLERASLIDADTGRAMPIRVTEVGEETLTIGGQRVPTTHFRVQGTLAMDIWYDMEGRWVSAAFTARGQRIEYRLTSPLAAAPR
jgi:hypothetical protein